MNVEERFDTNSPESHSEEDQVVEEERKSENSPEPEVPERIIESESDQVRMVDSKQASQEHLNV